MATLSGVLPPLLGAPAPCGGAGGAAGPGARRPREGGAGGMTSHPGTHPHRAPRRRRHRPAHQTAASALRPHRRSAHRHPASPGRHGAGDRQAQRPIRPPGRRTCRRVPEGELTVGRLWRRSSASARAGWAANTSAGWLFPGHLPGAHISAAALSRRLATHHIPSRPARITALVALACDLPPAVLGPMLGLHPITAVHWRHRHHRLDCLPPSTPACPYRRASIRQALIPSSRKSAGESATRG